MTTNRPSSLDRAAQIKPSAAFSRSAAMPLKTTPLAQRMSRAAGLESHR